MCVCVCAFSETQNFESFLLLFVTAVPASGAGFCCDSFAMWMQASVLCVSYARPRTGGHCPSIALARAYAHPHRGCIFVCAVALGGAARDEDACCRTCVPWLSFDLDRFVVLLPLSRVVTAQLRGPFCVVVHGHAFVISGVGVRCRSRSGPLYVEMMCFDPMKRCFMESQLVTRAVVCGASM